MKFSVTKLLVLGLTVALAACQDTSSPTDQVAPPSFAAAKKTPLTGTPTERAAQIAAKVNATAGGAGSKYRLTGASFFTVGRGVPPFRTHRTGAALADARSDLSDRRVGLPARRERRRGARPPWSTPTRPGTRSRTSR